MRAALDRAAASPLQGPASAKKGGRKSPGAETLDPQWSALSAARAGLRGICSWQDEAHASKCVPLKECHYHITIWIIKASWAARGSILSLIVKVMHSQPVCQSTRLLS